MGKDQTLQSLKKLEQILITRVGESLSDRDGMGVVRTSSELAAVQRAIAEIQRVTADPAEPLFRKLARWIGAF